VDFDLLMAQSSNGVISGNTWVTGGIAENQYAFCSEFIGIYSILCMVKDHVCKYYFIMSGGRATIGCSGLGPLRQCFCAIWTFSETSAF